MKKLSAIVISLILMLSVLTGCGNNGSSQATPSPSASPEATAAPESTSTPEAEQTQAPEEPQKDEQPATAKPAPTEKAPAGNANSSQTNGTNTSGADENVQTPAQPQQPSEPEQPQTPTVPPSVPVSTVMAKMLGAMDASTHNLVEMPSNLYAGVYQIDPAQFEEVLVYGAMINVSANEIIVIKAKDQNNLNQAVSALQNRKASQAKQYENYLADQYELIQQGTVTTKGLYATLVIAQQSSRALGAFQNAI